MEHTGMHCSLVINDLTLSQALTLLGAQRDTLIGDRVDILSNGRVQVHCTFHDGRMHYGAELIGTVGTIFGHSLEQAFALINRDLANNTIMWRMAGPWKLERWERMHG